MRKKVAMRALALVAGIPLSLIIVGGKEGLFTLGAILVLIFLPDEPNDQ